MTLSNLGQGLPLADRPICPHRHSTDRGRRLSSTESVEIRMNYQTGTSVAKLAKDYRVNRGTIR